jgi:hypothetical protein
MVGELPVRPRVLPTFPLSSREPVTFSIFSCFLHTQPAVFQAPDKAVILSEALRRSIANRGLMARSRRTPAMLVGRCSRELSGRKLQLKIKSHKLRAKPTCPGVPWRDLQFRGPLLETRDTTLKQNCHLESHGQSLMDRRKWHFASYV